MTAIRLISTTTRLPADMAVERILQSALKPTFASTVIRRHPMPYVDVQLVHQDDGDLTKDDPGVEVPDMDRLGVYIAHYTTIHRPVIKVSPERIVRACTHLAMTEVLPPPIATLYPLLF